MQKCINSWTLETNTPIRRMSKLCAEAGFDGVELALSTEGELNLDSTKEDCQNALEEFHKNGISVMTLTSNLFGNHHFASPNPTSQNLAKEIAVAMLDRAVWLEAPVIQVIPAVVGRAEEGIHVSYETALRRSFEGLADLISEAETRGVKIAIRSLGNSFILSPLEMRELVSRLNSPLIGVALHLNDILQFNYPEDWIRILGYRVLRVTLGQMTKFGLNEFTIDHRVLNIPEILRALREINYKGPLTYQGSGDLNQIALCLSEWTARPEKL